MATPLDPAPDPAAGDHVGALAQAVRGGGRRGPPPVHLWDPPFCGDIGLAIARDGTWSYRGSPIRRLPLVKLFASVLRLDPEGFRLVTPIEKVAVAVADAPFIAVAMEVDRSGPTPRLVFRTNVDDEVAADADHPLSFAFDPDGGFKPYLAVRRGLKARLTRTLAQDLADLAETRLVGGVETLGVESGAAFFAIEVPPSAGATA